MPLSSTYATSRDQLERYFDRTAADAWAKLTSDAPVSGVRATVRAGRDAMRNILLGWLPETLTGRRIFDAGCGAGQLSLEASRRGADVVGVDLSRTLVALAQERAAGIELRGSVTLKVGDMIDPANGRFHHAIAMDSVIHYKPADLVTMIEGLCDCSDVSVSFTFAPKTAALTLMLAAGQMFPRSDRSPAIRPIAIDDLRARIAVSRKLADWREGRSENVKAGFYFSQAMELVRR